MMGGGRKALVGGVGIEGVQLGAGEEGLGDAREGTMVSKMASAMVTIDVDRDDDDRGEVVDDDDDEDGTFQADSLRRRCLSFALMTHSPP